VSSLTDRVIDQHSISAEADGADPPASTPAKPPVVHKPRPEYSIFGLAAAALAALLPTAFDQKLNVPTFTPKYAAMLLFIAGIVPLVRAAKKGRISWASRSALAFLVVGLISVFLSPSLDVGFFGLYLWGTGWIFWLCCAGAFGLGSRLTRADLPLVTAGIIFGAVINGLVAIFERTTGPGGVFGLYQGDQATGLLGNPIHLEAIELCGVALLVPLAVFAKGAFDRNIIWRWVLLAIVSTGLELSLERVALVAFLPLIVITIAAYRSRAFAPVAVLVGSYAATYIALGSGLGSRVTQNGSQETYGSRIQIWKIALTSLRHHPFFGTGPGETIAVMAPNMTESFQRHLGPGVLPTDCHDILVEVLATTGIVGGICFVSWLLGAASKARGPLLGAAMCIFFVELVEPLNIGITPVAFVALGAATVSVGRPVGLAALRAWKSGWRWGGGAGGGGGSGEADGESDEPTAASASGTARSGGTDGVLLDAGVPVVSSRVRLASIIASAIIVPLSLAVGVAMIASDYLAQEASSALFPPKTINDAKAAYTLAPYFAQSADAVVGAYSADDKIKSPALAALPWVLKASQLDPSDPLYLSDVGGVYLDLGHISQAKAAFERALKLDPWTQRAFLGLANVAAAQKDWAAAVQWQKKAADVTAAYSPVLLFQLGVYERNLKAEH
jgi:hypothetical protein